MSDIKLGYNGGESLMEIDADGSCRFHPDALSYTTDDG